MTLESFLLSVSIGSMLIVFVVLPILARMTEGVGYKDFMKAVFGNIKDMFIRRNH